MKKTFLSSYFICLIVGGATFWGCFWLIKFIIGSKFGSKSVGLLTLFAPFITWIVMWVWYSYFLPLNKRGISAAIFIGIIGPLIMTWIYAFVTVFIPAAKMSSSFNTTNDYLVFVGMFIVLGPLSVLTYTGMLGAMMLNIISSPFVGWWLSKHAKT
ncbi:MAG: hypothetical protein A2Y81_05595 [Nitrospirae bacterium RBG_13_43_8]|nr:MAG: hypothetical protein A2Y81_05595 [Nitrospirae bacterium RBG_13_43_8]